MPDFSKLLRLAQYHKLLLNRCMKISLTLVIAGYIFLEVFWRDQKKNILITEAIRNTIDRNTIGMQSASTGTLEF